MISLEYFLGSLFTMVLFLFLTKRLASKKITKEEAGFIDRQSMYLEFKRSSIKNIQKTKKETQSKKHYMKTNIKVLIMEDRAFWIKDNAVYTAPVENDEVQKNSAVQVDMMAMNKVELDKMMFIVDKLRERQGDDSWNSGF